MKPNLIQLLFAYDVPGKLCYFGFPIAMIIGQFWLAEISLIHLKDLSVLLPLLALIVLSIPLAILLGGLFVCFFLSPFYYVVERMNGGPFKEGDKVYVILGTEKGKTKEVYSEWQGFDVGINIGEEEKQNFKDVYSTFSLLKVDQAEQGVVGSAEIGAPTL